MNANEVRAYVAEYFRYKRQCPIVSFERPINYSDGIPDILVVDKERMLTEVEIKISVSDLKAEFKKRKYGVLKEFSGIGMNVYKKYFAVPDWMDAVAKTLVPKDCGIITVSPHVSGVMVFKKAKPQSAKPLYFHQVLRMIYNQSGTLVSMALKEAKQKGGEDEKLD